ncbi:MAG: cytochrome c biogenesis CcdA family protein [Candidatus Woesearchaeota archaeon]
MGIYAAFLAGLMAAFTPCVIVLIPALIYRFSQQERNKGLQVSLFAAAFLGTFLLAGILLEEVLSSTIKHGFQLGIGLLFIVLGILALRNRFNPLQFPLIKNPLLFGALFALIVTVNPCTFAYISIIATNSATQLVFTMLVFATGLLIPALVFSIFGMSLLSKTRKATKVMHYFNTVMNALLIGIGAYLIITIKSFGILDTYVAGALLLITFLILLRAFFVLADKKRLRSLQTILLLLALIGILVAVMVQCTGHIKEAQGPYYEGNPYLDNGSAENDKGGSCDMNSEECKTCTRCMTIFSGAAVLGFLAILLHRLSIRQEKNA